jgi:hypothetical protein
MYVYIGNWINDSSFSENHNVNKSDKNSAGTVLEYSLSNNKRVIYKTKARKNTNFQAYLIKSKQHHINKL